MTGATGSPPQNPGRSDPRGFFLDLVVYLSVMFLVREVYFEEFGFIANGLLWSLTTVAVAAHCVLNTLSMLDRVN